ncbi:hypothetical protein [Lactococcus lactis]|uniref:Uncharacterized protein n=1 Tax=Lactococcus lactis TaxID=1358 RepID=A0AAW5TKW3_9LACT|nr:hypothetical protein [Lactococcus lactis]MCW2279885.1 hypothetical protein [Lactococcus lactis]
MITTVQMIISISIIIILAPFIFFVNKRLCRLEREIERCRELYDGMNIASLRFKINTLEDEFKFLYKFKVMFKRKNFFDGREELQERYFFNKKQADEFININNFKEAVIIELGENKNEVIK